MDRYHHELGAARARLAAVDRRVLRTPSGDLEYAEQGDGEPLLVVHGIFQGSDGGLLAARELVADRRVIAPSRFGYLRSTLPSGATPADQADAFALLLDELGIGQVDVLGISAGATSVLQFALRHPDRTRHLVVLSGNLPGSPTATVQPRSVRFLYGDPPLWALRTLAPSLLARAMGVPTGFQRTAEDDRYLSVFSDSIFPVGPRAEGALFDAFVSNADVNSYDLESLEVPTMILHARDDPLASYEAAERAAARIPGSVLVTVESGGHLMLGQHDHVRTALADFLASPVAA